MRVDNLKQDELAGLVRRVRRLESAAAGGHAAVSKGTTRFIGNESLKVLGSAVVSGWLIITGTFKLVGTFLSEGLFTATGRAKFNGPVEITDTLDVSAQTTLRGATTIENTLDVAAETKLRGALELLADMLVSAGGKITISGGDTMTLDASGGQAGIRFSSGGYLASYPTGVKLESGDALVAAYATSAALAFGANRIAVTSVRSNVTGDMHVTGDSSAGGAKTFRIPHPTKPGHLLLHGATESPVSGIEYWGEGTLNASGAATVELPDYFDALAKPGGRIPFASGRGFVADWSDIEIDRFTVRGSPHGKFSWLVKAERFGGDFELEPVGEEPQSN